MLDREKFEDSYKNMTIEGWYKWLNGYNYTETPDEIYWAHADENTLKEYIKCFEEKYGRKLKYRIDGIAYISYVK